MTSNRKFNMRKHIERKHQNSEIPDYLLSAIDNRSKYGKYVCPYCKINSNRKYNMRKHIERKHQDSKIPDYLLSASYNYNNNGYIHREPQNFDVYLRAKRKSSMPFSFLNNTFDDNTLPTWSKHKKEKDSHSIIRDILQYFHLLNNLLPNSYTLPKRDFPIYNPMLNLNYLNFYKNFPLPSMDLMISWNKEILFRMQRCNNCNRVYPIMFYVFDNIKPIIYCEYCKYDNIERSQKQNDGIYYLTAKEFLIKTIVSFIDKDKSAKINLKGIKIPADIYTKLLVTKEPFFSNDKENGNSNIPSWMVTYIMDEEFINLGVIDDKHWAYRLINNNEKSIEITKSDLIEFINYGDSTFGLFKFHKDNISVYFFSYLQIERIKNT